MSRNNSYTGSIDLIGGLRPKNGGTFPLIDAEDIQVEEDGTRLSVAYTTLKNNYDNLKALLEQVRDALASGDIDKAINLLDSFVISKGTLG